jgi:hypothetical protein
VQRLQQFCQKMAGTELRQSIQSSLDVRYPFVAMSISVYSIDVSCSNCGCWYENYLHSVNTIRTAVRVSCPLCGCEAQLPQARQQQSQLCQPFEGIGTVSQQT